MEELAMCSAASLQRNVRRCPRTWERDQRCKGQTGSGQFSFGFSSFHGFGHFVPFEREPHFPWFQGMDLEESAVWPEPVAQPG